MKILNRIIRKLGYVKPVPTHDMEDEFHAMYEIVKNHSKLTKERHYANFKAIEYIVANKIPGDILEAGCWNGGSVALMGLALKHFGDTSRKLWLYDTFQGITEPEDWETGIGTGVNLLTRWKEKQGSGGWMKAHYATCFALMQEVGYTHQIIVGDIMKSTERPEKISLLRLDLDIYPPTKWSFETFYPSLSKNGVLILDDYGSWSGVRKAADDFLHPFPLLTRVDASCRVGIKT